MATAAADPAPPEMALPEEDHPEDISDDAEEELCRICFCPGVAGRPLRHPCACQGTIGHVHDECQLKWFATRHQRRCQVCRYEMTTLPLFAEDAPARLPLSEFMAGLPGKLMSLLLPVFLIACVCRETAHHLTNFSSWHLVLTRSFPQPRGLLSLSLSTTSIVARAVLSVVLAQMYVPFAVAPFTRWVERLGNRCQGIRGIDALHVLALLIVQACWVVLIADMAIACIFGFLPFSLGRINLWCMSPFNIANVGEVNPYISTASTILVGYIFLFTTGVSYVGLITFHQYLGGKPLMIAIFCRRLSGIFFSGITILFPRLPGIFFGGVLNLITVANIGVNILYTFILHPLFIGWLLDICTSKMFGATMSQRLKLLIASSSATTAVHWFIGHTFLCLRPRFFTIIQKMLKPRIMISFVRHNVHEPFYIFYFKKLPGLSVDITFIALLILIPSKIVVHLAPKLFPLNITYFDYPAMGTSFWQGPLYYTELLSGVLYLKFLIESTVLYLEWLVPRVGYYWFVIAGKPLLDVILPDEQPESTDEVTVKRVFVVVQTIPQAVLSWLVVVICNTAMLFFSISIGRTLLSAIPELLVDQMKSNDLFAIAIGFGVISFTIAASRDAFVCMTYGGTRLVALKIHVIFFLWVFFIPLLIGLLVDLSLLSPFIMPGPGNDIPVLNFFCTWSLGRLVQNYGTKLGRSFELRGNLPFYAYFIDKCWSRKLLLGDLAATTYKQELLSFSMELLTALAIPYVLSKEVFPRLGYSAVNSTVHHAAWLYSFALCVLCYLAKESYNKLHDSIWEDRYIVGQRLEDVD
ncbi:probable E3 ubiquitin ligase SUD1 [Aegilops tauschii subsp. strangulata]|nr:probable E3 ubiquitin ligase SUD1 [Aegilops tauschii subsp. strangulata]